MGIVRRKLMLVSIGLLDGKQGCISNRPSTNCISSLPWWITVSLICIILHIIQKLNLITAKHLYLMELFL